MLEPEERLPWVRECLDVDPFNTDAAAELQLTRLQMGRQLDASVAKRCFADATSDAALPPPPMPIRFDQGIA